jgi:hypothetical protein
LACSWPQRISILSTMDDSSMTEQLNDCGIEMRSLGWRDLLRHGKIVKRSCGRDVGRCGVRANAAGQVLDEATVERPC